MDKFNWMGMAAFAALLVAGAAPGETLRVTGDRVNVRAKPGFENSEVLGQLAYDQRVERLQDEGEWVGVAPPDSVSFWVNGDYIRAPENVVTASRVNLRAGPSVNYTVLGTVERGMTVTVRRSLDGWLEIAPPEGTCVWVYREYVEPLEPVPATPSADAAAELPQPPPPPQPPVAAVPAEKPASPVFPAPKEEPRTTRHAARRPAPPPVDSASAEPPPEAAPVATPPPPEEPPAAVLPAPLPLPRGTTTNAAAVAKPPPRARGRNYTRTSADLPVTPIPVPSLEVQPPARGGETVPATPIVGPSEPARNGEAPGLPAKFKLVPLDGQGRQATYEGTLRAAPLLNDGPTRYRVLLWQANRWQLLCHVVGEAARFRELQDKHVRVRGKEYWVQDVAAPVLVPEQIQEIVLEETPR